MFRLWGKLYTDNHLMMDTVYEDDRQDVRRTHKVLDGLAQIAQTLDLAVPIWLDQNIADFQKHSRTRFTQDSFIEPLEYDFLEIQVIEES